MIVGYTFVFCKQPSFLCVRHQFCKKFSNMLSNPRPQNNMQQKKFILAYFIYTHYFQNYDNVSLKIGAIFSRGKPVHIGETRAYGKRTGYMRSREVLKINYLLLLQLKILQQ